MVIDLFHPLMTDLPEKIRRYISLILAFLIPIYLIAPDIKDDEEKSTIGERIWQSILLQLNWVCIYYY